MTPTCAMAGKKGDHIKKKKKKKKKNQLQLLTLTLHFFNTLLYISSQGFISMEWISTL